MKFFDLFKSKKEDNSPAKERYEKALSQFKEGNYQEALRTLSWGFSDDVNYKPLYKLSAECLDIMGGTEEAQLFEAAHKNFKKVDSFKNLGVHFYHVNHYDLAIPFLKKAFEVNPKDSETAHDLAVVYARRFQVQKGIDVLEKNNPQNDFWNYWFWLKLKILSGKTEGVLEKLNQTLKDLEENYSKEEVEIPKQKVEEVKEMLVRYNEVPSPKTQIQDWQFIQYGSIILDFFDDPEDYVAGGRYVAAWGNNQSIKEIAGRLKYILEKMDVKVDFVKYLNSRDSEIIGRLIGKELGVYYDKYEPTEANENCLIVAANSTDFDEYYELSEVKHGQITFALNHSWLGSAFVTPDIMGLMSQSYYFPWNGGGYKIPDFGKGEGSGGLEKTEADNRDEEVIAASIYNEEVEINLDTDENIQKLNFYLQRKDYLKGIGTKVKNKRFNFMVESPVPGSFFR